MDNKIGNDTIVRLGQASDKLTFDFNFAETQANKNTGCKNLPFYDLFNWVSSKSM